MTSIVLVLTVLLAALGAGCGPLVTADSSQQGPVVPTRHLPTQTPTVEPTTPPTQTPIPTRLTPTEAVVTTEPTPEATRNVVAPTEAPEAWTIAGWSVDHALDLDETHSDTITTRQPLVRYGFRVQAGDVVDLVMTNESGNLDPFLIVIDSEGRELARNDDHQTDDTNAAIRGLTFAEAGDVLILASRFGQQFGESVGDFNLDLSRHDPDGGRNGSFAEPIAYDELREGTITNARSEYVYTFAASAGDLVSAQASATSGNLDTALALTNNAGNTLARNDDDITNASTDAALREVLIPADGVYSLVVSRFQGVHGSTSGDFRLKLTLEARDADEGGRLRYAALNPLASGTVRSDGDVFTDYFIGDQLDDDNVERTYQVLLTFWLPEASPDTPIDEAVFLPGPCSERGTGLAGGALVVYRDRFAGVANNATMADIGPAAVELGRLRTCDALDITAEVESMVERGERLLQLRLVLPDTTQNGETDAIGLSEPRVSLLFAQPLTP